MSRAWGIVCGFALLCAMASPAAAQSFGGLADKAETVSSSKALAALFWSHSADCKKASGDLAKRQCRAIASARKGQLASSTFLVRGGAGAVKAGDAKGKSIPVAVHACIACDTPLDVGGKNLFVVAGDGAVSGKGGGVSIKAAHTVSVNVKSKKNAKHFTDTVVPRLKTELIVKVGSPKTVKAGGAAAYRVDLLGFRLYDPCDGKVYAAKPKSSSVKPDKRYCSGEPVEEKPVEKVEKPKKVEPELPRKLSPNQIRDSLQPARAAALKCFDAYGVPGTARFRITISNNGDVIGLREKGDFVGTPTSKCIRAAVKTATFPKTRKARTTIDYPFILR